MSLSEFGQLSNDAANAALRFKSEGIDRVIFIDVGCNAAFYFMQAADRQDYHPRHGLSSQSCNQELANQLGGVARSQLHGALSIGWYPIVDTRVAQDPDRNNPTRARCFSIMREAGVAEQSGGRDRRALIICDALWSLAAALDGASVINQATFLAGINGLQATIPPESRGPLLSIADSMTACHPSRTCAS